MPGTKKQNYLQELEWLMAIIKSDDYESRISSVTRNREVSASTIAMAKHYHDNPSQVADLMASYHRIKLDMSKRDDSGTKKKGDLLQERAFVTAGRFLESLESTDDSGQIPGFEDHLAAAARELLQAFRAEVSESKRPGKAKDPADGGGPAGTPEVAKKPVRK